jgi:DNA-binding HxlR family transcriptional regulator
MNEEKNTLIRCIGHAWTVDILRILKDGLTIKAHAKGIPFGAIKYGLSEGSSAKVLSVRLKEMMMHGLITRKVTPNYTKYAITEKGKQTLYHVEKLMRLEAGE